MMEQAQQRAVVVDVIFERGLAILAEPVVELPAEDLMAQRIGLVPLHVGAGDAQPELPLEGLQGVVGFLLAIDIGKGHEALYP